MNVSVIEELTFAKQPKATEQLPNGGSGNDGHVEQAVVRNGVGCLTKTCGITDADRHHFLCKGLAVGTHGLLERLALDRTALAGAGLGAAAPFDILPAVWLTSALSVSAGLLAAAAMRRLWR